MKCFLGISNFLEEISSLSHSFVFLYFFVLIAEEGFLISPCYYSTIKRNKLESVEHCLLNLQSQCSPTSAQTLPRSRSLAALPPIVMYRWQGMLKSTLSIPPSLLEPLLLALVSAQFRYDSHFHRTSLLACFASSSSSAEAVNVRGSLGPV